MANHTLQYSFWNGKNLEGTQEYIKLRTKDYDPRDGRCVIGSETVAADDLLDDYSAPQAE